MAGQSVRSVDQREMFMNLTLLPITLASAGAAALLNFWLAFRVGLVRASLGGGLGYLESDLLLARARAHSNFAEYTPFVLILIGAIELAEGPSTWLGFVSAAFLVGRIAHPLGMEGRLVQGRLIGQILAMLTLLGLGLYALSLPLRAGAAPVALHHVAAPR